ncbi:MAG: glycosyltransferase [Acidobacteria bacterium]|nr:glycosyltransferase [Acidobacteriota bacterium]
MALRPTIQAGLLAGSRAAGQVLNAIAGFVLVRFLTQVDFGTFRQIYLLFGTLVVLVDIGLTESLFYYIPGNPSRRGAFMRQSILAVTGLQFLVGAGLVAFSSRIGGLLNNPDLPAHMLLFSVFLGLNAITRLWEVQLTAEQRVPLASAVNCGGEALKVALMLGSLAIRPDIRILLWAMVIAAAIKMLAFLWFVARDLRWFVGSHYDAETRAQFGYGLALWLPAIVNTFANYIHQYIVSYQFTPAEFAIYSTACFQVPFLGALTTSIIEVMLVRVTAARAQERYDEVKRTWNGACTKGLLIFMPMAVGLAAIATPLMTVLFGWRYAAAGPLFAILMIGLPLNSLFTDNMLRAYGAMRSYAGFYSARLALGLLLGVLGVYAFGMWGVALSASVTMLLIKGWQLQKVARLLEVSYARVLPWREIIKILVASMLAAVPVYVCSLIFTRPLLIVLIGLPIYCVVYPILVFRFGLLAPILYESDFRKRRILLFTDSFIHGGTERQFVETLRRLDREKYEIFVGCLKRSGPFLAEVEAMGFPIVEFPIAKLYGMETLKQGMQLLGFIREKRIDVVHCFDFYTNVFAIPVARLAVVPVVLAGRREMAVDRTPWQQRAIRMACSMATGVVANSRAAGSRFSGWRDGESKKLTVIPNSLDLDTFRADRPASDVRKELSFSAETPLVGILAALRPEKDHVTFLRAAGILAKDFPQAHFLLIGDGTERLRLETLTSQMGIAERVHFLGGRNDISNLLPAMDVLALSSVTESFPNAILEGMAAALPVVATNFGGTPELVEEGKTGFLVPVGDSVAMAARIAELLREPSMGRSMGAAGRARVEREFTPQKMKERLEGLYDRELRIRRPSARILQIGNYPPPVCGWSIHTQLVERELAGRGADSRVMDIGPARRIAGRGCIPTYSGLDYFAKLLLYRARSFTFHVHVNGDSWKGYTLALMAVLLGSWTDKPSVLTFHAGPKQMYFPAKSGFWYRAFRLLFRASGEVICNHEPVKKLICEYGVPEEKVHAIPAFSSQYHEEIPVALSPAVEQFFNAANPALFSYSLFRPEFTMEALFEAFAAVRKQHPRAGLLIAGPKEVPPESLEQLRRLGIEESVFLAGNLPHAEFLTAVQRSAIFVRTHLRDGVCSSVLEALQLGVPVVAAEDGIRPPSVITYAPGDAADLAKHLLRVLADLDAARAQVTRPIVSNNLQNEISLLLTAGSVLPAEARG